MSVTTTLLSLLGAILVVAGVIILLAGIGIITIKQLFEVTPGIKSSVAGVCLILLGVFVLASEDLTSAVSDSTSANVIESTEVGKPSIVVVAPATPTIEAVIEAQTTPTVSASSSPSKSPSLIVTPVLARREDIAQWRWQPSGEVIGPPPFAAASEGELLLYHGDLVGDGKFSWRVFQPSEATCKPSGTTVAARIWGGTEDERRTLAEETIEFLARREGISDWRSVEALHWCRQ